MNSYQQKQSEKQAKLLEGVFIVETHTHLS